MRAGGWPRRILNEHGMLLVLGLLCLALSVITLRKQPATGEAAGEEVAEKLLPSLGPGSFVLIVATSTPEDEAFTDALAARLVAAGARVDAVWGEPSHARAVLDHLAERGETPDALACTHVTGNWLLFSDLATDFPALGEPRLVMPESAWWPAFLTRSNLLNVAHQAAVIALIAIGMTMVIVTGGIDLSVGSLVALSAVVCTLLISDVLGGVEASAVSMAMAAGVAILLCGLLGAFNGALVTAFRLPPFIVTLAMMLIARGYAGIFSGGESVYKIPPAFVWLGGGDFLGVPIAVLLTALLYGIAHVLMGYTIVGRYLYAVGGNAEAARLSGVPVRRVQLLAYTAAGLLAGLGGVVLASRLKSGAPTYGVMYELSVIAAVVVGGTSLSGGEGKILGTLVGVFIIAVIQNGMNLLNVGWHPQQVVLGKIILVAVLLDRLKHWLVEGSRE